jgi:predicted RNase H-like nuclease (RuvC/YqgF family)
MQMDVNSIYAVIGTAIAVLGSASAWRYWEKRAMHKERDDDFIRHDCKDRISKLEALLESAGKEKDEMRKMILDLTRQVAELKVTVEYLRAENNELHTKRRRTPKI